MANGKCWTFTIFDYDDAHVERLKSPGDVVDLLCFQEEKSPSTGALHLQGYVRFTSKRRLPFVKAYLGSPSAHLEIAKGSPAQNLAYCTKSDSATGAISFQHGEFGAGAGRRTDLDRVVALIQEGKTLEEINTECPSEIIKYGRGIQLSRTLQLSASAPTTFERCCIVLWGRSGAGKSLWARDYCQHRGLSLYSKPLTKSSDVQWFDGYDGEECLLLDDFTDQAVGFRELLIWLDLYKHRVQIKGGMAIAAWRHVIITSNEDPATWYTSLGYPGDKRDPLTRRLDHILQAPAAPLFVSNVFATSKSYPGRRPPSETAPVAPLRPSSPLLESQSMDLSDDAVPSPYYAGSMSLPLPPIQFSGERDDDGKDDAPSPGLSQQVPYGYRSDDAIQCNIYGSPLADVVSSRRHPYLQAYSPPHFQLDRQ